MGFIKKIFRAGGSEAKATVDPQDFQDTDSSAAQTKEREAPRRELIHSVLRETIQRHGIPSDWIGCRVLSVVTKERKAGAHVQFIVRKGDEQLLGYVHQFQESFWRDLERVDPRARDWLFSVSWQFDGKGAPEAGSFANQARAHGAARADENRAAHDPLAFDPPDTESDPGDTLPTDDNAVDLESDLAALQAAISNPAALEPQVKPPRR
ncbi:hypothetical protein [Caenimonas sp. SL110]|uniref:hypothetical protein n=1 Tax=Caenimonas sp. SL110 TaxID=1450524 RepID=UPI00069D6E6E|nr:hypothetical protein [Caenimonas sp. SL110]